MRAYEVQEPTADFSGVVETERERPAPADDEVLIRIHACSLNYRDIAIAHSERQYARTSLPAIPLSDGAGEVVERGANVEQFETGDRVATPFSPNWIAGQPRGSILGGSRGADVDGPLAQYVTYPAESVPRIPSHFSYEEGATLPCAGLTAWNAIAEGGGVTSGEQVLLLGTGGVSTFALQFADMHGADPFVISSSDAKLDRARALGAKRTLNYEKLPEWGEAVQERTGGGVDHVVEIGGAGTIDRSVTAAAIDGTVHMIGVLSDPDEPFNPLSILGKGLTVNGILGVGSTAMFQRMSRAIETNEMTPVIDRTFDFEEVQEAYEYVAAGDHYGKVVIDVP